MFVRLEEGWWNFKFQTIYTTPTLIIPIFSTFDLPTRWNLEDSGILFSIGLSTLVPKWRSRNNSGGQ